jgi:hypothetical protein
MLEDNLGKGADVSIAELLEEIESHDAASKPEEGK